MGKYKSTDPNHTFPNRTIPAVTAERAQAQHTVDATGCWITTRATGPNGYAQIGWQQDGKAYSVPVHRASYTHSIGPIADGMVIDHLCHNRACVNPEHLRELPRGENARRQIAGDFPLGQCRYGHPLSESRTRGSGISEGLTYCGACQKERNDVLAATRSALYNLELAYGLGEHEEKRNYPWRMRLRQERVDAVAADRMQLTPAQQAMYDEFMPQHEVAS